MVSFGFGYVDDYSSRARLHRSVSGECAQDVRSFLPKPGPLLYDLGRTGIHNGVVKVVQCLMSRGCSKEEVLSRRAMSH
jgi:hypothetical protein